MIVFGQDADYLGRKGLLGKASGSIQSSIVFIDLQLSRLFSITNHKPFVFY